jgi:hypothetical protein
MAMRVGGDRRRLADGGLEVDGEGVLVDDVDVVRALQPVGLEITDAGG